MSAETNNISIYIILYIYYRPEVDRMLNFNNIPILPLNPYSMYSRINAYSSWSRYRLCIWIDTPVVNSSIYCGKPNHKPRPKHHQRVGFQPSLNGRSMTVGLPNVLLDIWIHIHVHPKYLIIIYHYIIYIYICY